MLKIWIVSKIRLRNYRNTQKDIEARTKFSWNNADIVFEIGEIEEINEAFDTYKNL